MIVIYPEEVWDTYVDQHDIDEFIDEHSSTAASSRLRI